jgi:hypothetical protein
MRLAFVILLLSLAGALANEAAPRNAPYDGVFDPWRACTAALDLAKQGAPDALRTCFLAAYVRVSQPFLGGEDLESMIQVFDQLITAPGDETFSRALAKQRPEVRSAVGWFLNNNPKLKQCPKTAKLLHHAPKIDWPLVKAYRDDR